MKVRKRRVTPYPPPTPPPDFTDRGWGGGNNCKIKTNPCNHPTSKVLIHLQKQLKVDDKIKINPCKQVSMAEKGRYLRLAVFPWLR